MNVLNYIPAYSAEQWAGIAAFIASVSAVLALLQAGIALGGLIFVGRQIREARRTSDAQNLFAFYKSITDAEHALVNAADDANRERVFFELANLLEVHAMALRGRIYTGVTKEAVELKLIDACAVIQLSVYWYEQLEAGRTTQSAFKDLFMFIKRKRRQIERVKRHHQLANPSDPVEPTLVDQTEPGEIELPASSKQNDLPGDVVAHEGRNRVNPPSQA